MQIQDDRTGIERSTHNCLVVGLDTFLSGWGKAKAGLSYAAWACRPEHQEQVLEWVRGRGDMKGVKVRDKSYIPSGNDGSHYHIYVVAETHKALQA